MVNSMDTFSASGRLQTVAKGCPSGKEKGVRLHIHEHTDQYPGRKGVYNMIEQRSLTAEEREKTIALANRVKEEPEQLMNIMFDVQKVCGNYISREAAVIISQASGIAPAKVFGYVSFYSMLSDKPRGKYALRMCKSAPCHVRGARGIMDAIEKLLGIQPGETTGDGLFTLEYCECLGLCIHSPAIMINDKVYHDLTPGRVIKLLDRKSVV